MVSVPVTISKPAPLSKLQSPFTTVNCGEATLPAAPLSEDTTDPLMMHGEPGAAQARARASDSARKARASSAVLRNQGGFIPVGCGSFGKSRTANFGSATLYSFPAYAPCTVVTSCALIAIAGFVVSIPAASIPE